PERFRPERFLESKPTPYEFLPFGGGVRRCLGMAFALVEMKIVLGEVLTRVELHAAPGYQVRVVRRSVTLAPSEGMPVMIESRAAGGFERRAPPPRLGLLPDEAARRPAAVDRACALRTLWRRAH